MANGNGPAPGVSRWIQWTIGLLVSIDIAITSFAAKQLIFFSNRMTAIEANRFTSADGLEVWRELEAKADRSEVLQSGEVLRALDKLQREIDELKSRIGRE